MASADQPVPPDPPAQLPAAHAATPAGKPRARSLAIPFDGTPGRWNAITDVPGVEVGYATLIAGDSVRTGVTAVHPRGAARAADPVIAGFFSQNGNGEMTGVSWIQESGTFAGPVAITNTHAVGIAHAAIIEWAVRRHPRMADAWLLPVAAETWDGYLNDINGQHVTQQVVLDALTAAATGPVEEGSVGGGTGMNCYHFKGGSGTASRRVDYRGTGYCVGVFVQATMPACAMPTACVLVIAIGPANVPDSSIQDTPVISPLPFCEKKPAITGSAAPAAPRGCTVVTPVRTESPSIRVA